MTVPLVGEALQEVKNKYKDLAIPRLIHETVRRIIDKMVKDLVFETKSKIKENNIKTAQDVRDLSLPLVSFPSNKRK
jgi:dGTPase